MSRLVQCLNLIIMLLAFVSVYILSKVLRGFMDACIHNNAHTTKQHKSLTVEKFDE